MNKLVAITPAIIARILRSGKTGTELSLEFARQIKHTRPDLDTIKFMDDADASRCKNQLPKGLRRHFI